MQTALGRLHAFLGFVCGEKFFRLRPVLLSGLRLFLLHIFFECHHCVPHFLLGQKRFLAGDGIFESGHECVLVYIDILPLETKTNVEPDAVARLVF